MIEIRLMEQLTAFSEAGTLSAAAEKLHTSQPALTRSMKKLEEELGVSLFSRSKNRLEFNETGKIAAEYANRVLKEEEYFEERVRAFDRSLHTLQIGYCAPIPQLVLTPLINSLFEGITISTDMGDDREYLNKLESGQYQLAVVHEPPSGGGFYYKKCGHEDLFISLRPSDPLTFYPEIHLHDLNGKSVLLLSQIGFWKNVTRKKTPDTHYLLQVEQSSFDELSRDSDYPIFTSSYFLRRHQTSAGRINVSIADSECHTDYYLVCLKQNQERFRNLFQLISEKLSCDQKMSAWR